MIRGQQKKWEKYLTDTQCPGKTNTTLGSEPTDMAPPPEVEGMQ